MSEEKNHTAPFSRRSFLKTGTLFTLLPSFPAMAFQRPARNKEADAFQESKQPADPSQPPSPAWTKDLIIYEIATKGFTSPNGPESGTFASLKAKLPYLQALGITGIWLTGYSLCDPHHFYNIWTQYAVIEPGKFDPTLGTAQEFKSIIDDAHSRGIKVFLDVITHGLMQDSSLIREHPSWFRGRSWGMTDFDWNGGHTDLDDWWVDLYTHFVVAYGVDGYRLDVSIQRPDLWERIRRNAASAGHPVAIWEEVNSALRGVTDFSQHECSISTTRTTVLNSVLANDIPGFYARKFGHTGYYEVEIEYSDCQVLKGNTRGEGPIAIRLEGLAPGRIGRRMGDALPKPDGLPNVKLHLDHIVRKPIKNLTIRNDAGDVWQMHTASGRAVFIESHEGSDPNVMGPSVDVLIATLTWGPSIQLSCHDNGWQSFPLDKSAYAAKGSRSLFGYSFLFTPMIPIFFSGEEFDATFHALPDLSPDLFGGKNPGKGRWLYGAMLDWKELQKPEHKDMFLDVQKMMAIRKRNSSIMAMMPEDKEPRLKAVEYECPVEAPVPYLLWGGNSAVLVAGNRNRLQSAPIRMKIDLDGTGLEGHAKYSITDLWGTSGTRTHSATELKSFECDLKQDGVRGGGLAVVRIEPI